MYQIKINAYSGIFTDNVNLNVKYYYDFINELDSIIYINKKGFILEHKSNLYFFQFTNEEINYFNSKQYRLLPFTHQRLIRKYHMLNDIIESESEKNEYLEILLNNKPNYSNLLKTNLKNKNYSFLQIIKISLEEYKKLIEEWNNKIKKINELNIKLEMNNSKNIFINKDNIVDFNENIKTFKKNK